MKNNSVTIGGAGSVSGKGHYSQTLPATQESSAGTNKRSNTYHHLSSIIGVVSKVKARYIVKDVKRALNEVELIEKGIKKPKSLDQLLNEL